MKFLYLSLFILVSIQLSATAPTTPASNLHFSAVDGAFFNVGWTSGNGTRRVIVCKAGSAVTFVPQNGVDYTENTVFGTGQQVAPGEYVIYDNAFTSFFVTGLTPATQYFFAVFEYNGTGINTEYLTSSFLTGSATTSAAPTIQSSNASFSNVTTNSVTVSCLIGNGARRLIVVREGSAINAEPVNSQPYAVNSVFGSGATIGAGNYTVYNSSGNGTTVTNLTPGTQYFFSFFEFNGSSQPQYKTPAYTTSITTRSIPTVASSNVAITKADGKELSLGWTNGNGQRRIIVAKKGSNVTSNPVNGTDYAANSVFGQGPQLSAGEYVVFDDNFNAATITGLEPATTYFFKIFEYDGTGNGTIYLTSSFGSVDGPTATTPFVQSTALGSSELTGSSIRLNLTPGNGRARMIVGRKNAAVNINPQDFLTYAANGNFGSGQDMGNGNFVLANTVDASVNIHNLETNTTYHFAVFEYNGYNQPLYLSPAAITNATTLAALPVNLVDWEAVPAGDKVRLHWSTASEINTSHFIIERSADGRHFAPIATVQANGNTQSEKFYVKEDVAPLPGKSYYRLKMVDMDGHSEYSAIRSVLVSGKPLVALLGNPVRSTLEFVSSSATNGTWQIVNITGQVLKNDRITNGRTQINVSGLARGIYWINVVVGGRLESLRFVKE
jgi:hypothetical protein